MLRNPNRAMASASARTRLAVRLKIRTRVRGRIATAIRDPKNPLNQRGIGLRGGVEAM